MNNFDGLTRGLRFTFWALVYVGALCGAVLAFAPLGQAVMWAALVVVLGVLIDDTRRRMTRP